ncbi:hypothetical protein LMH73_004765 [Vibrio splendidus]|nr:hypothetical protein [Vibrio splendidus]MCC4882541.1 hypothetical protein [Vibrio splendidus]
MALFCLVRVSSAFMSHEHREAMVFSTNKLSLESISERISPFVTDKYIVEELVDIKSSCEVVAYCHQNDSDINYSIINDDLFMEDSLENSKKIAGVIVSRIKSGSDGLGLKVKPVMHDVNRDLMASIFREIGGAFGRHVSTYRDFCTLQAGYRRLRKGAQSERFYLDSDFAGSLIEYHGFIYDLSMID